MHNYTMPFCHSPWTNIDISPQGDLAPCCKFQHSDAPMNVQHHTLAHYRSSDCLSQIKQQFIDDRWPRGCERCRIEEENGIESKRQLDQKRWLDHYDAYNFDQDGFVTASIAFGNTCNLTCITCGPYSSSRWQNEYLAIYGQDIKPFHFYKRNFVSDLIAQAPNLIHLDIPGGEPFLSGVSEQQELLARYVESGQAKGISLHYTTNCTVWPDQKWWDLWQDFKEIDLQISVDGIDARYEYLRYPAKWAVFCENLARYQSQQKIFGNLRLSVSHTVSAFNIFYLDEFFSWCYNVGLPRPWLGRVHTPVHMRPSVWPLDMKSKMIDHLCASEFKDVVTWGNLLSQTDDSQWFDTFRKRTREHDTYRKTDFARTFPELAHAL